MSRASSLLGTAALVLALAACSLFASETGPRPADVVAVTGRTFILTLDANRSTGFAWELAKPLDEDVVRLAGTAYEQAPDAPPGAVGKEVWTFDAVAPGWAKIELVYRRPWEEMAPAKIAVFSVEVE